MCLEGYEYCEVCWEGYEYFELCLEGYGYFEVSGKVMNTVRWVQNCIDTVKCLNIHKER